MNTKANPAFLRKGSFKFLMTGSGRKNMTRSMVNDTEARARHAFVIPVMHPPKKTGGNSWP